MVKELGAGHEGRHLRAVQTRFIAVANCVGKAGSRRGVTKLFGGVKAAEICGFSTLPYASAMQTRA